MKSSCKDVIEANVLLLEEGRRYLDQVAYVTTVTEAGQGEYVTDWERLVQPYSEGGTSSMGNHFRHVYDRYTAILDGLESSVIDLTQKDRSSPITTDIELAIRRTDDLKDNLLAISNYDAHTPVTVLDCIQLNEPKKIGVQSTLESVLLDTYSHTIHHFFMMRQIGARYDISPKNKHFGYHPDTTCAMEE